MKLKVAQLLALCGAIGTPQIVSCQVVRIPDGPTCADCINAERMVELGSLEEEMSLGGLLWILRSSRSYFAISPILHPTELLVYDSPGTLKDAAFRPGQGPGEFRSVLYLGQGRGDSILVGERGNRIHVFSGDGQFGRTLIVRSSGTRALQLPDGRFVVAGQIRTASEIGVPLHLYSPTGEREFSFGGEDRIISTQPLAGMREISLGSDSTVWAARQTTYRIEEWSREGTLIRTLEREADWFPPAGDRPFKGAFLTELPDPTITGVQFDGSHLWVSITVAAEGWTKAPKRGLSTVSLINRQWDTVLEVIDLASESVLARTRLDGFVRGFCGPREVFTLREDSMGLVYGEVWSLTLHESLSQREAKQ